MPYDQASLLNVARKLRVFRQEAITGMDHVDIVLQCDLDDFVSGQVGSDRSVLAALSNDIGLIRFCKEQFCQQIPIL
jgi:hypothetical protein